MTEEAKHVVHQDISSNDKKSGAKKARAWKFFAAVLGILLIASIATSGFDINPAGTLSKEQVGEKTASYINENVLRGQASAKVKSVEDSNGLYLLNIEVDGQSFESYATKDGGLLFPQAIKLDEALPEVASGDSSAGTDDSVVLEVGDAPVKGNEDAPVTVVEFSDFSCQFCGAASGKNEGAVEYMKSREPSWEAPLPGIIKDYVGTGKAKLVFKYFPGHGTGEDAMKLAWCSNEQGMFWEVHDAFFENQEQVGKAETLKGLAVEAGVDRAKLEECYESGRYDGKLASDAGEGKSAGVSGTPTFFINGARLSGAQSFPALRQVIEEALKGG